MSASNNMAEGDEGSADCRLVARLCGVLEAVADGAPLAETSAACRAAIADHVVELERAEAAAADALDGVLAVQRALDGESIALRRAMPEKDLALRGSFRPVQAS